MENMELSIDRSERYCQEDSGISSKNCARWVVMEISLPNDMKSFFKFSISHVFGGLHYSIAGYPSGNRDGMVSNFKISLYISNFIMNTGNLVYRFSAAILESHKSYAQTFNLMLFHSRQGSLYI